MNMTQTARRESYISPTERKFAAWLGAVEAVAGHVNDSDAWDLYRGEYTVAQAAAELSGAA